MAEDTVKRVTGMSPMFPTMSDISSVSIPFSGSPSEVTSDAAASVPDDPSRYFPPPAAHHGIGNCLPPEISSAASPADDAIAHGAIGGRMPPAQLQKRMCGWDAGAG